MTDVPSGFSLLKQWDEVMGAMAPLYFREDANDYVTLGFHVGTQHCNPHSICHGGTWATLADIAMGVNVGRISGISGPTVSLSIDFLGSAKMGQWVEGCIEILRWTPNLGFAQCRFTANGQLALRANAVFRRKYRPQIDYLGILVPLPGK